MAQRTRACGGCKEKYPKEELINYENRFYCNKCYQDRIKRDYFSKHVCAIFKIKTPGPRIWAERKRLIEKFGFTDEIIVQTLKYVYDVKKQSKIVESLCLITPVTVEEARTFFNKQRIFEDRISNCLKEEHTINVIPTQLNTQQSIDLTSGMEEFFK